MKMRNKQLAIALALTISSMAANAQEQNDRKKNFFNHMDFGVTAGSTGLGFDLAMPVGNYVRLRTGMSVVPRLEVPMTFGVQVGDDPATSQSKFERLSGYLSGLTGNKVKQDVDMIGKPKMWNWNFMVDIYPLKNNRHWHVTAGFFLGPSKVAEAQNDIQSMATLMAVDIYNNLYDKVHDAQGNKLPYTELAGVKIIDVPGVSNDLYMLKELQSGLHYNGRMGVQLGTYSHDIVDDEGNILHKKGENYMMEPDENSMVSADMKVNAFKPYLGVGYDGRLVKKNDHLHIGFDAGVMMWGGTPHLTTHDGTDMIHDVENIPGKVGDYVSAIEKFKVFPVANLRISYRLF